MLKPGIALFLIALITLVSVGSRSHAFHEWVHGKKVSCCLKHASKQADSQRTDSPTDDKDKPADPLQPFCQAGFDVQVDSIDVGPKESPAFNRPAIQASLIHLDPCSRTSPPRAPPTSV